MTEHETGPDKCETCRWACFCSPRTEHCRSRLHDIKTKHVSCPSCPTCMRAASEKEPPSSYGGGEVERLTHSRKCIAAERDGLEVAVERLRDEVRRLKLRPAGGWSGLHDGCPLHGHATSKDGMVCTCDEHHAALAPKETP